MDVVELQIPEIKILRPTKHGDARGFFSETYNKRDLKRVGIDLDFVQDNQSYSSQSGTLRGLHFQIEPFAQDKLVRVLRGRILDVAVDIRKGSPTFGQHVKIEISAKEWNQILVPKGFAHAILTLEPDTEILYKVTNYFAPACDKGLFWNDADLRIEWPLSSDEVVLSAKDAELPLIKDLPDYFAF